jgi:molybdopterin molybdotransferase
MKPPIMAFVACRRGARDRFNPIPQCRRINTQMASSESSHPNADVRMRGFAQRSTVDDALAWIDSALPRFGQLGVEEVSLQIAAGRVLARDVVSPVNVPGFARAMMDGFAVIAEDTHGATAYNPLPLKILGTCLPSSPFPGKVVSGCAVRIMTGAPLPNGADAVLPIEVGQVDGQRALALNEVSPGKHVGQLGEDVRTGDVVERAGRLLRPQDIGLLSSLGFSQVAVIRQPRVRILITGNELLPMGTPPDGYRVTDANGPMLAALVARDGGEPDTGSIIPDDRDAILTALRLTADSRQSTAEIILVSGASSVGQEDHAPTLLAQHGELAIHGIAMRPSSPTGMGRLDGRLVFLLPGNPVSCLCAYDFFAGPAIRSRGGRSRDWPYRRTTARLSRKLVSVVGRVDYARVKFNGSSVEPVSISGASVLSSVTRADGFVIVPMDSEGFPEGADVEVFLY